MLRIGLLHSHLPSTILQDLLLLLHFLIPFTILQDLEAEKDFPIDL
jgi:hypothetical protein